MTSLDSLFYFSYYDHETTDDRVLNSLSFLLYEYWQELDHPHKTMPVNTYKRRITNFRKSDMKVIYILMEDTEDNAIGFCSYYVNHGKSNKSVSKSFCFIRPEYRQKGYFKILFLESVKYLPKEVKILQFFFRIDSNQKYVEQANSLDQKISSLIPSIDANLAFIGRRSESDITKHNVEDVSRKADDLVKKAHENGYSIVAVDNINFTGLSFTRKQFANLLEELDNDMPRDESVQEDHTITEKDFLNWYVNAKEDGMTSWYYVAVDPQGLPIALSETRIWNTNPDLSWVGDTGVKKDHRGKKLGLTLKMLMLRRLLTDPLTKDKVKYWITFNAKSNKHMIAINDTLGYYQSSLEHQWEIPVEKLQEYFESH